MCLCVWFMQSTHMASQQITEEAVYLCTGNPLPEDSERILTNHEQKISCCTSMAWSWNRYFISFLSFPFLTSLFLGTFKHWLTSTIIQFRTWRPNDLQCCKDTIPRAIWSLFSFLVPVPKKMTIFVGQKLQKAIIFRVQK